jgi:hypothetical protein
MIVYTAKRNSGDEKNETEERVYHEEGDGTGKK